MPHNTFLQVSVHQNHYSQQCKTVSAIMTTRIFFVSEISKKRTMVFSENIDNNIVIRIVNVYLFLFLKYGWDVYEIKVPN
jgi:hypothetical protein